MTRDEKRARFGEGPWLDEPDSRVWIHKGIACLVVRNPDLGQLNGYIGVPKSHPWNGKHYDKIRASVHGGITYAKSTEDICRIISRTPAVTPEEVGREGVWWVGFDTGHAGDYIPGSAHMHNLLPEELRAFFKHLTRGTKEIYRTFEFVVKEVEALAEQAYDLSSVC